MNAYGTMREEDVKFLQETIARTGRGASALIPILQALQEHHGYLPEDSLRLVPELTEITAANLTGVSTFYDMFRHQPTGKHIVRVCRGTACHVAGADRVEDALRRRLRIPPGRDTDAEGLFTLEPVACLGCCTLAPVMKVDGATMGVSNAEAAPELVRNFLRERQTALGDPSLAARPGTGAAGEIRVGLGSCCMAKGSDRLFHELQTSAAALGAPISVKPVGCVGMCHRTPLVEFVKAGETHKFYAGLGAASAAWVVRRHFGSHGLGHRISRLWTRMMDGLLFDEPPAERQAMRFSMSRRDPAVSAFLDSQKHIVTEHFGKLNPLDLDEYIAHDGFTALRRCLATTPGAAALTPEEITATIENSGLRGRGGAGFPTGAKWRLAAGQSSEVKYVICNGDEGDPGAFMDRMILESFPYRVIEGLAIAAIAIGAHEGIFYVRHEYPLAVTRLRAAIAEMERRGWLGARLLGADYQLRISVAEGAGAFVCGEETALIASLEGRRGTPRLRPPFPAQSGLWEKPTLINNVETLAAVPWILRNGAQAFATIGVGRSKGTKVFALAGKVRRGGLIEVPMGMTIRQIVEDIGGGVADERRFKAVQIGGPSGGCVPARLADTPVDYESLAAVGAIMGSGGMVVLDDTTCMVDIARYFLRFTQDQSCGKCTFCRVGTRRMLDIMDRICAGKADRTALQSLEHLAHQVCGGSLCGLGRTAPNPVLSTLKYFREEYEAHLHGRCPAGRCTQLIAYRVTPECTGCTLCAQRCPAQAIPFTPYARHEINLDLCTRCDTCRQVCPANAIEVS
jgi:NADH-quinone oxidoreductase subunit F